VEEPTTVQHDDDPIGVLVGMQREIVRVGGPAEPCDRVPESVQEERRVDATSDSIAPLKRRPHLDRVVLVETLHGRGKRLARPVSSKYASGEASRTTFSLKALNGFKPGTDQCLEYILAPIATKRHRNARRICVHPDAGHEPTSNGQYT
jgi:hypothetical protein